MLPLRRPQISGYNYVKFFTAKFFRCPVVLPHSSHLSVAGERSPGQARRDNEWEGRASGWDSKHHRALHRASDIRLGVSESCWISSPLHKYFP